MNFRIPLSSPDITEAEIEAVTAVLRTPRLSLGPELLRFEDALAEYHGVPHAVAVSSGTAGLHLALLTLGIGPGDEVIIPSFVFIAVANAVLQVGATPVFVDIDPVTLNLDPDCVQAAISSRARAMVVVHTFGVPAEMTLLCEIARRYGLHIIEDACEAIGATYGGRRAGTFGDLAVFGFYPNKQLTTGEGGAVLARKDEHAARLRSLRNQGRSGADWLDHQEPGYNYRLSELACALGRVQLQRLDAMLEMRHAAAHRYNKLLSGISQIEIPPANLPCRTISWFVYVVRTTEELSRNRAQIGLAEAGIASARYFAPIHLQPAWRKHASAAVSLPITEQIARRTLAIPLFNRISEEQQQEVTKVLANILIP